MSRLLRLLGYIWGAPVTFVGVVYSLFCWAMGWYKWHGIEGDGIVWFLDYTSSPKWLVNLWRGWAGHAIGNVVVLSASPSDKTSALKHELKHVNQCMRLGIFQPIVYAINMLAIKIGCSDSHPYYDNPFEIDARRHSGQTVDVVGLAKKAAAAASSAGKK